MMNTATAMNATALHEQCDPAPLNDPLRDGSPHPGLVARVPRSWFRLRDVVEARSSPRSQDRALDAALAAQLR